MATILPTSDKPLLLVDIDGVLNCFGNLGASLVSFEQEFQAAAPGSERQFTIRVPMGTLEHLQRLESVFEPVWCSTWEGAAHAEIGARIGINEWPHIAFDNVRQPEGQGPFTWKLETVIKAAGERPLAWIDDELYTDAREWALGRNQSTPTLLVPTRPEYGLEAAQVDILLAWAAAL